MPIDLLKSLDELLVTMRAADFIRKNPLPDETASSRVKQAGMYLYLSMLHHSGIELTLTNISEYLLMGRQTCQDSIGPLVDRGLVTEAVVKNSMGRGKAILYTLNQMPSD